MPPSSSRTYSASRAARDLLDNRGAFQKHVAGAGQVRMGRVDADHENAVSF